MCDCFVSVHDFETSLVEVLGKEGSEESRGVGREFTVSMVCQSWLEKWVGFGLVYLGLRIPVLPQAMTPMKGSRAAKGQQETCKKAKVLVEMYRGLTQGYWIVPCSTRYISGVTCVCSAIAYPMTRHVPFGRL